MTDDPFAPVNDPYLVPDPGEPSAAVISRRTLGLVLLGAPVVAATGCSFRRLACEPREVGALSCRHRFCRHYSTPTD